MSEDRKEKESAIPMTTCPATALAEALAKATPGPWEAQDDSYDEDGICIIALQTDDDGRPYHTPTNGLVAIATMQPTEIDAQDYRRASANAAFIAAAKTHLPELLAEHAAMRAAGARALMCLEISVMSFPEVERDLRAALAAHPAPETAPARDGWRPIADAPKDGSSVLAICASAYAPMAAVTWWSDGWMTMSRPAKFVVIGASRWFPTDWMPLPTHGGTDGR